jgi:ArsR family transcriptional regulator
MKTIEKNANIFKALSDPTRLRILHLLAYNQLGLCKDAPLCVNALTNQLEVSQSAVSQHLRILRQADLVQADRQGSFMHYSIDPAGLKKCADALGDLFGNHLVPEPIAR